MSDFTMSDPTGTFHYGPDALLEQARWELQLLAADASRALRLLEAQRAVLRRTREAIADVEASLRALYSDANGISLGRRALLQGYLEQQRAMEAWQQHEVTQAQARHEQTAAQLHAKRVDIKVMETHRARKLSAHVQAFQSRAWRVADNVWLVAGGARAGERRTPALGSVLPFTVRGKRRQTPPERPARIVPIRKEPLP